ncbi:MAG: hypothetical protein IPF38_11090 [Burkholderiales bacterium]|nr:hypothetical protein [Burkholderiales bacterium]
MDGRRGPSNFLAFKGGAAEESLDTKGESIAKNMQKSLPDMRQGQLHDR